MLFGRVSGFVWLPPEKVWIVLRFSSVVLGWYCGSLRLLVGDLGFVGFIHIPRLALRVCCCLVLPWLFFFFPRLASRCFFWCWIGSDCIALSPLAVSSLLLYCLASSCLALIGLALPCLLWLDVVLDFLLFSALVLSCLAVPCLDILISVALVYSPLL